MDRVKLDVRVRTGRGTIDAKAMRLAGDIPGVIYSAGTETVAITINARDLRHAVTAHGIHSILDVAIDGKSARPALIKDMQLDPVRDRVIHIDLHEIRLDQKINTAIRVNLEGHAEGVNMGGALSQPTHELRVEALPAELVDAITVDVSELEIGQSIRLADITPPEGITFTDDPESTILATIAAPVSEEELKSEAELEAEVEAAEAAEALAEGEEGEAGADEGAAGDESLRVGGSERAPLAARLRPVAGRARGRARKPRARVCRHPSQPRLHGHRPAGVGVVGVVAEQVLGPGRRDARRRRAPGAAAAADLHEPLGPERRRGDALLQARAGCAGGRARRDRPAPGRRAGEVRRRARRPQRPALAARCAGNGRVRARADRRRPARAGRPPARRRLAAAAVPGRRRRGRPGLTRADCTRVVVRDGVDEAMRRFNGAGPASFDAPKGV